ncbi:AN1-type zinc finger protein 1 [Dendroctonus ponderosae]|uniref:ZFAND1-like ubiquitin-like domain-containing protein n=2 Tax=Dendroctonus ponderosae TaxID=77166 RepID=A0AAR5Q6N8_DENPD|nr:AN1-type zinc finger protein 1 [Dendroctonus ponderosae]KAH1000713.1 hypothetical protein HUJ04_013008 [Dendroctonus ponderosae]
MELPGLGERCTVNECLQLDFLPLRCQCGKVFCSQHLQSHSQTCSKSRMLTEDELKCFDNVLVCSQDGCKDHSIVPMICPRCAKHFCIKHRHLTTCQDKTQEELQLEKDKFLQPARQFEQAKTLVDQQIQRRLAEGRKKPKSKELADKVQLMKIKNKATGLKTIPVLDKVYFNIHVPGKVVPVFVSKNWSLGRAIDAIADECKLPNNNNKSNEKKLRLFRERHASDPQIISDDMSKRLSSLLAEKALVDGEDLVIQYVFV